MIVGLLKETYPNEKRVAVVPEGIATLKKAGIEVQLESGAGENAGFTDKKYQEAGGKVVLDRTEIFSNSDVILQVRGIGIDMDSSSSDLSMLKPDQLIIGFFDPFFNIEAIKELARRNVCTLAMELIPRISRAQPMDALSSQSNIAGYKAAIIAAEMLPRMFPMMITAAGTITPSRVLVIGAGVPGLQAMATCRRLGAVVSAYDIRPAVKEQVESLGAKFIELKLETKESEQEYGYAKEMDEDFYTKQRNIMKDIVAENDVIITTASVPGKKAPILITSDMVDAMKPGSVIVDIACAQGGNCELTETGKVIIRNGITITGPLNIPSSVPYHSSKMYSKNIINLLLLMVEEGKLNLNVDDQIIRDSIVTMNGQIVNKQVREIFGL
ncbi:MAG: Re/Si-specific NAD(P)(+) transhydrogenase subunit alpha [Candidatus Dadabacteria bacterium]|nr:Re/Si-specific NAD(P)(+) transhydrogenase subunit alpha [Candidatus Dadabacteria bacterium]NIQ13705.1 Re/Si-specific NAD(P)(+) transhydrogenase subunit alpha [Candidatus Dadabacteria bacterium]